MSRKPRRVPDRIQDMLEAIRNAESDIAGMGKDEFLADGKIRAQMIDFMSGTTPCA